MRSAKHLWHAAIIISMVLLAACNIGQSPQEPTPDVAAIMTAAVQTVIAGVSVQMTQTALAAPPTPTFTPTPFPTFAIPGTAPAGGTPLAGGTFAPLASPTPLALATQSGPLCDDFVFIADITVPDGTEMDPGEDFQKIWRIQNTGICTWDDGYYLVYAFGNEKLDGPGWELDDAHEFTAPGETLDVGMWMTAPLAEGEYTSCWQMKNDRGVNFGPYPLCAVIKVEAP